MAEDLKNERGTGRAVGAGLDGTVLEIQRMSTEDGPGLRTTLFLKGCSLRCRWCHNPESIEARPQPRWTRARCLGCSACVEACPEGALALGADGVGIDRALCRGCGACEEACPSASMELWGHRRGAAELAVELLKDEAYFGADGGVTVSGGEACLQAPFVRELLSRLRSVGVGTAIDTCGMCPAPSFEAACEFADIILYDLKDADPASHGRNVGGDIELIRANFRRALAMVAGTSVAETAVAGTATASAAGYGLGSPAVPQTAVADEARPKRLWVRTPIIPGMTDRPDNVRGLARFMLEATGAFGAGPALVERWELCAFNNLCSGKYRSLGRPWELEGAPLMGASELGALVGAAVAEGWPADRIRWTGMTRNES